MPVLVAGFDLIRLRVQNSSQRGRGVGRCIRSRLLRTISGAGAMALVELDASDTAAAIAAYPDLSVAVSNSRTDTVISGEFTPVPRCEAVPVRLPLPPAPDAGSIFKAQKTGGAKSVYAAE